MNYSDYDAPVDEKDKRIAELEERIEYLKKGMSAEHDEVMQILGAALGFPWFKDDQKNFPGATEEHGICPGDHVPASMAELAAKYIASLNEQLEDANGQVDLYKQRIQQLYATIFEREKPNDN